MPNRIVAKVEFRRFELEKPASDWSVSEVRDVSTEQLPDTHPNNTGGKRVSSVQCTVTVTADK